MFRLIVHICELTIEFCGFLEIRVSNATSMFSFSKGEYPERPFSDY